MPKWSATSQCLHIAVDMTLEWLRQQTSDDLTDKVYSQQLANMQIVFKLNEWRQRQRQRRQKSAKE